MSHYKILSNLLGSTEAAKSSMLYSYKHGFSGFAARLTESQAKEIEAFPGVVQVMPNRIHKVHTTRSWEFMGLNDHSPENILSRSNMGEGIIIGVIDTGVWPESASFNDKGMSPIPSHRKGICQEGELFNSSNCNKKLIGARWFIKGILDQNQTPINTSSGEDILSARDGSGHGNIQLPQQQGQSIDTRIHNHGFTGITFSDRIALNASDDSALVCKRGSLNATLAAGKIILCFSQSRTQSIFSAAISVAEAGGVGLIFAQYRDDGLDSCNFIPCIKVDYEVGTQILSYIRRSRSPIAKLSIPKTVIGKWLSPRVADFSARGPSSISPTVLKPDIAAPGVDIVAAYIPFGAEKTSGYALISKSVSGLTKTKVDCTKNRQKELNLNLPSITIPYLKRKVTVRRKVTNVGPVESAYKSMVQAPQGVKMKVEPRILRFNETTQILPFKVTFFSTGEVYGDYRFGSLIWREPKHIVRIPVSVRPIFV
ncbi:hypothetical protein V6N11_080416 [Hibiscus sabdariffa]|uniref:Uncharacterized protein n=1 Tax=Hibiscus sabdariffa TaxID=183260 RepID=A0ABR2R7N0_9ROSI